MCHVRRINKFGGGTSSVYITCLDGSFFVCVRQRAKTLYEEVKKIDFLWRHLVDGTRMKAIFMPHSEWQSGKNVLNLCASSDCIAQELPLFANYSANTLSRALLSACGISARLAVDASSKLPSAWLILISTLCEQGRFHRCSRQPVRLFVGR